MTWRGARVGRVKKQPEEFQDAQDETGAKISPKARSKRPGRLQAVVVQA